jgi:hypothetical protein
MVSANADPSFISTDVIDTIRIGPLEFPVDEVVNLDFDRSAGGRSSGQSARDFSGYKEKEIGRPFSLGPCLFSGGDMRHYNSGGRLSAAPSGIRMPHKAQRVSLDW